MFCTVIFCLFITLPLLSGDSAGRAIGVVYVLCLSWISEDNVRPDLMSIFCGGFLTYFTDKTSYAHFEIPNVRPFPRSRDRKIAQR